MKRMICAILLTLAVLAASIACAETAEPAQVGLPAPDFEVKTLEGETLRLSDLRGKTVYLNLWATWCPPCRLEMPDIQKLAEAHPDDLVVIGVSLDESETTMADFVEQNGYTWQFAMDWGYEIGTKLYPTNAIPYSVFISPDGVVASMNLGMMSYEAMEECFQHASTLEK